MGGVIANVFYLLILIGIYGPFGGSNLWGKGWYPVSEIVLNNFPAIYNPLPSSFNAHLYNLVGNEYMTPLVYVDDGGEVRNILAKNCDINILKEKYIGASDSDQIWFEHQLEKLNDKEKYISISKKHHIVVNSNAEE